MVYSFSEIIAITGIGKKKDLKSFKVTRTWLTVNDLDRNVDLEREVLDLLNSVVFTSAITDNYLLNLCLAAAVLEKITQTHSLIVVFLSINYSSVYSFILLSFHPFFTANPVFITPSSH